MWRRVLIAFACAQAVALWLPLAALATTSSFTSNGINDGPLNNASPIADGSWIAVGFSIADHNHSNPATTLYLRGASAVLTLSCTAKGSTHDAQVSIPIPEGPYQYPADYTANGGWWPTGAAQSSLTYQTSVQFASPCANGGPAYIVDNGEQYIGTLASSDNTTDLFHIQLHTAIPDANKQANIDCADSSQNPGGGVSACNFGWNWKPDNLTAAAYSPPTPTPSPTPTPAPTPQPTPTPSPSSSPTASPSPSSDPGSSSGSGGTGSSFGGGDGSGGVGGTSSGGWSAPAPHFYPTTVLGAHASAAAFSASLQASVAAAPAGKQSASPYGASGGSAQYRPAPVTNAPPLIKVGPLLPVPVVSPILATGSLLDHLPMQWYALLAAVDCVLVLAIFARRNRARSIAMNSRGKP